MSGDHWRPMAAYVLVAVLCAAVIVLGERQESVAEVSRARQVATETRTSSSPVSRPSDSPGAGSAREWPDLSDPETGSSASTVPPGVLPSGVVGVAASAEPAPSESPTGTTAASPSAQPSPSEGPSPSGKAVSPSAEPLPSDPLPAMPGDPEPSGDDPSEPAGAESQGSPPGQPEAVVVVRNNSVVVTVVPAFPDPDPIPSAEPTGSPEGDVQTEPPARSDGGGAAGGDRPVAEGGPAGGGDGGGQAGGAAGTAPDAPTTP